MSGMVYLVGAGPGDPDMLTVRAARLLRSADVVLHDALVSKEVLALAAPHALLLDVGKRCGTNLLTQQQINFLLIHHASRARIVVRLKGGDPLIFGRAGEEIQALRRAGIGFEVLPGITAALAAAAAAGISLTDRRCSSQILFTTAQRSTRRSNFARDILPGSETTRVVYMPGPDYALIVQSLLQAGLSPATPCVLVSCASLPGQQIRRGTLADLGEESVLPAPALLIVGRVAGAIDEIPATSNTLLPKSLPPSNHASSDRSML